MNSPDDHLETLHTLELAFNLDEVWVHFAKGQQTATIWFIWDNGNEGRDCITDYHIGPFGDLVDAFSDKVEELWA